jgi:[ribosomal protein S18]-alanine N-acetyltransferase
MSSAIIEIRKCKRSDLYSILSIEQDAFGRDAYPEAVILDWLQQRGDCFFVAQRDQQVIGYLVGTVQNQQGFVISLAVALHSRQSGVASALLNDLKQRLLDLKVTTLALHARITNHAAINLYLKLGYKIEKTVFNYYQDNAPAYRMVLSFPG